MNNNNNKKRQDVYKYKMAAKSKTHALCAVCSDL